MSTSARTWSPAGIAGVAVLAGMIAWASAPLAAPVPSVRSGAVGVAPGGPNSAPGFPIAGTTLYDNTGNADLTYYAGQNGAEALDDLHMVSGGALGTVAFEYYEPAAGPPITATVRIYTNPGGFDGDLIPLAGPYVVQVPAGARNLVGVNLPDRPVAGAHLWVGVQFSSASAGLIIKDVPSMGTSHDLYFESGNIFSFGGTPKANFALKVVDVPSFGLDVTIAGQGTVTRSPDRASYAEGTVVQLSAAADLHWHFAGWSVDASGSANPLDVTMDGPKSVTATFAIDRYTLTYTPGPNGTISGTTPQTVDHGANGTQVTAVPDANCHFVGWSDGVVTAARTDLAVTADLDVTATFAPDRLTLTYTAGPNGTISGTTPQTVDYGTNGTLVTAMPNAGYHFVSWSDGVLTAARTDMNVTTHVNVTATFEINTNLITNGSFETDLTGWSGYNGAVLALVSGGQDGSKAVRVTGPVPGVDEFGLNDSPSWITDAGPAGTTYEISAYVRSESSTSPVKMRIREYKNGVRIGPREYSDTRALTNGWQKITMQYVTRATGTSFDFQILNTGAVPGDVFLVDNVVIRLLGPGPSVAVSVIAPTASSVLVAGAYCLARWSLPGTPVDSSVVSATVDGGDTWSVVGSARAENQITWHLPYDPSQASLFVRCYSNGVVVGDAVSEPLNITRNTLGLDDEPAVPRDVYLAPPQPAPFTTHTMLNFGLPSAAKVRIRVLDLQGRGVATLADGVFGAGRHDVTWHGTTSGRPLGAGIYFVRMDALGQHVVRKLAIAR